MTRLGFLTIGLVLDAKITARGSGPPCRRIELVVVRRNPARRSGPAGVPGLLIDLGQSDGPHALRSCSLGLFGDRSVTVSDVWGESGRVLVPFGGSAVTVPDARVSPFSSAADGFRTDHGVRRADESGRVLASFGDRPPGLVARFRGFVDPLGARVLNLGPCSDDFRHDPIRGVGRMRPAPLCPRKVMTKIPTRPQLSAPS